MAMSETLQQHLAQKQIEYDLVPHPATASAMPTAEACHVSGERLAKGVVVRTADGYVLAVLPATLRINREDLKKQLGEDFALATEDELDQLFRDCARGAVPAVGECYGLNTVVEDSIREQPEVYFEAGDHTTVVRLSQAQFAQLTGSAPHGRFGSHV